LLRQTQTLLLWAHSIQYRANLISSSVRFGLKGQRPYPRDAPAAAESTTLRTNLN
jgi:hypothetical protein